ncbi:hypothetical protein OAF37_04530 [Rubripirellula sp.]|nr:hypothetical protein [Rubripirellula sp.]MDA7874156.1 hypothetical protein [Rhodopirellula sp.]MDB4645299.1 hypothetical protein [Rubripirellula sp.]
MTDFLLDPHAPVASRLILGMQVYERNGIPSKGVNLVAGAGIP